MPLSKLFILNAAVVFFRNVFVAPAFRRAFSFVAPASSQNNRAIRRCARTTTRRDPIRACHGACPERSRTPLSFRAEVRDGSSLRSRRERRVPKSRNPSSICRRFRVMEPALSGAERESLRNLSSRGSPDAFYRDDEGSRRKLLRRSLPTPCPLRCVILSVSFRLP